MRGPRLIGARWLKNHGLELLFRDPATQRRSTRFVGPKAELTMAEAAVALRTYTLLLYRMRRLGRLKTTGRERSSRVPMAEVYRIKAAWAKRGRPSTRDTALEGITNPRRGAGG